MARIVIYETKPGVVRRIVTDETNDAQALAVLHPHDGNESVVEVSAIKFDPLTVDGLQGIQEVVDRWRKKS